jgi:hypothetical protein
MVVCPYVKCNRVMYRQGEGEFSIDSKNMMTWQTICPHCKNKVRVRIGVHVTVEPII